MTSADSGNDTLRSHFCRFFFCLGPVGGPVKVKLTVVLRCFGLFSVRRAELEPPGDGNMKGRKQKAESGKRAVIGQEGAAGRPGAAGRGRLVGVAFGAPAATIKDSIIFMPDSLAEGVRHPQGIPENSQKNFILGKCLTVKGLGGKPGRTGENNGRRRPPKTRLLKGLEGGEIGTEANEERRGI